MEEHKKHRTKKAGPKAERKKENKQGNEQSARQRNPKAFAIQSAVKAAKKFHRSQDVKTKKIHIPLPDRTVLEPPPVVVGIVGPPKVGKTTLLQCLVKNYTRQKITNIQGPVTVVSGKQRRLTFMECGNDINHMIDIAKVADLVILMVDASFGFEMEIFEFLNILQVHGFPKVMGVLNHLDTFNDNKKTRKTKKRLKDRFWTEIYQGAKLFYLSGMIDGEYQKTEIHNLCRFISVMKFRPLTWRTSHPYILADRMEDITPPEEVERNPKCDRRITLYGYNRGVALKNQQAIHIPGMGDFRVADVEQLADPCPTPEMEKRRTLNQKERLIYAPMSGVGGILYDKDAVYIDVGGSHYFDKDESEEMTPVKELLLSLMGPAKTSDSEEDDSSNGEDEMPTKQLITSDGRIRRKAIFNDEKDGDVDDNAEDDSEDESDEDDEEEDEEGSEEEEDEEEKNNEIEEEDMEKEVSEEEMEEEENESGIDTDDSDSIGADVQWETEKAVLEMKKRKKRKNDYHRLIYGESEEDEGKGENEEEQEEDNLGDLFRVMRTMEDGRDQKYMADQVDSSKFPVSEPHNWDLEEVREKIADCFVTGRWDKDEDCTARLEADDELYGDFEDLETGEKHAASSDEVESGDEIGEGGGKEGENQKDKLEDKKKKQKQEFDVAYDHGKHRITDEDEFLQNWKRELEEQAKLNRAEFENMSEEMRQKIEGFRPGLYLRVEVAGVPCEFIQHFRPTAPLILGGLSNVEENIGYLQTRFKKHRFYKNQLKTKNPLTMSLGWRRFQTLPVFSKMEDNMRQRMLKYTPPHIHCMASFWGPITPQGSGVLAVIAGEVTHKFRICGTGVVLELDKSLEITKKLKLTGTPFKIMQKTAYIQGMFNSALEVAKFEGATLKTVSGVRGIVKKSARRLAKTGQMLSPGTFRATFEDKILLSDIVFLTTWYPVQVPQFYNPSTSLLGSWQGMKSVGQLRQERGLPVPHKEDSLYRPVEHRRHKIAPLRIPASLNLPFKLTPKPITVEKTPVILEPSESKKASFLHQLKVVHEFNMRTKHAIMRQRAHKHSLQMEKRAAEKGRKLKVSRQEVYRQLGKMEKAKAAREKSRNKHSS